MFEEFQLQSSDADQALLKVNISENQEDFVFLHCVNFFFFVSRYFHLLCGNVGFQLSTSGRSVPMLWSKRRQLRRGVVFRQQDAVNATTTGAQQNHHKSPHPKGKKNTVDQQLSVKSSSQLNNLLCVQINEVKLPTLLQKEKTSLPSFLPSFLPSLFSCSCQTIQTRADRKKKWNFCKGRPAAAPPDLHQRSGGGQVNLLVTLTASCC